MPAMRGTGRLCPSCENSKHGTVSLHLKPSSAPSFA